MVGTPFQRARGAMMETSLGAEGPDEVMGGGRERGKTNTADASEGVTLKDVRCAVGRLTNISE